MKALILGMLFFAAPAFIGSLMWVIWSVFSLGSPGLGFAIVCALALGAVWAPVVSKFDEMA